MDDGIAEPSALGDARHKAKHVPEFRQGRNFALKTESVENEAAI